MNLRGKKVLVVGLKKTGMAVIEALKSQGAIISAYDGKSEEELPEETVDRLKTENIACYFDREPENMGRFDLLVSSPGVPLNIPVMAKAAAFGVEIIGEVELAYRLGKGRYIGITGTNGKTTTTALTGAILKEAGFDAQVVGNIGDPVIDKALNAHENTWMVTELSSFQLETIDTFRPEIAALLNLSPDHIDRHGSFEKYIEAKSRIFMNQGPDDYFIYNYDDERCRKIAEKAGSKAVGFSGKGIPKIGTYMDGTDNDSYIMLVDEKGVIHKICPASKLKIRGQHNLENALAATAISFFAGAKVEQIEKALEDFPGVAHRLENLGEVNGIAFVNDSKGTNTDSSIKALRAIETPIILIAGGYDKSADYEDFIKAFDGKVKALILIGETAEAIRKTAMDQGYKTIFMEEDMEAAVKRAYGLGTSGDTILLSPACASWDMYENFEERGDDFRSRVEGLKEQ